MRIGVVFPQTEISADPGAIKDYAQTAEGLGFSHISTYDHVIGANPASRAPGRRWPYTFESTFHEPLILFGYLAGVTTAIEFATSIIILPQRQTVLAAKQAAAIDVLSRGRLRLGVGLGWNEVEYEALGENFHTRGRRVEDQIALMRELWTKPLVTYRSEFLNVNDAGIAPLPVQQPIPVWMGATVDAAIRRAAKVADGWFPMVPAAKAQETCDMVRGYVRDAGRDPAAFGLEARLEVAQETPDTWAGTADIWRAAGATHLSVNTMRAGLQTPSDHILTLRRVAEALGVRPS